jgi:hypothetical protein
MASSLLGYRSAKASNSSAAAFGWALNSRIIAARKRDVGANRLVG